MGAGVDAPQPQLYRITHEEKLYRMSFRRLDGSIDVMPDDWCLVDDTQTNRKFNPTGMRLKVGACFV